MKISVIQTHRLENIQKENKRHCAVETHTKKNRLFFFSFVCMIREERNHHLGNRSRNICEAVTFLVGLLITRRLSIRFELVARNPAQTPIQEHCLPPRADDIDRNPSIL